jgi:hypothetical protein
MKKVYFPEFDKIIDVSDYYDSDEYIVTIHTGTVAMLGNSGSYGIRNSYLIPEKSRYEVPIGGVYQFERCPYCNRKNHVSTAVCDGCGGVL